MAKSVVAAGSPSRQSSLDVLKCVAAFFVVCIHYGVPEMCPLVRCAVPVFFMISGYYYPMLEEKKTFWRHFRKLFVMVLVATSIYLMWELQHVMRHGEWQEWIDNLLRPGRLARWVVYNESLFGFQLWYFYALLYDLLLLHYADKWKLTSCFKWLVPLLLAVYFFAHYTHSHFSLSAQIYRNWLVWGLPCMMLGRWIREGQDTAYSFMSDERRCWLYASVSFALVCAEWLIGTLRHGRMDHEMYVFTLPLVLVFFYWALRHPQFGQGSLLAWIGHRHSANIYIIHVLVAYVLKHFFFCDTSWKQWMFALFVFALSLLSSMTWVWLRKRL